MYITDKSVCFNSNILGYVTLLVIPFVQIIQIEKKSLGGLIPNAIIVQTLHEKYTFATLLARDATYDLVTNIWNFNIHKDDMIGNEADDDNLDELQQEEETDDETDSEVDDTDEEDEIDESSIYNNDDAGYHEDIEDKEEMASFDNLAITTKSQRINDDDLSRKKTELNLYNGIPFSGPKTHPPTDIGYTKKPNDTLIADETLKAPVGVVYSLLFGDDTSFMRATLEKSKNFDISAMTGMKDEGDTKKEHIPTSNHWEVQLVQNRQSV